MPPLNKYDVQHLASSDRHQGLLEDSAYKKKRKAIAANKLSCLLYKALQFRAMHYI